MCVCLQVYACYRYSIFPPPDGIINFFFDEEDWPCVNICRQSPSFCLRKTVPDLRSVPIFLYFVYGTLPQYGLRSTMQVPARDLNLQTWGRQSGSRELNHYATWPAPTHIFLKGSQMLARSRVTKHILQCHFPN